MFKSDIMLLDEPFGGLDAITRRKMQQWLLQVIEKLGSTILFITHDIDEAIFLSDRIFLFTERPASVRRVFPVNIERPREAKLYLGTVQPFKGKHIRISLGAYFMAVLI